VALQAAEAGVRAGRMPFGAALVIGDEVVAVGHNRQIQDSRLLAHAETECLNAYLDRDPRLIPDEILVATEAPCPMCAGAAVVAGIRTVVIGERHHYAGATDWLIDQGVQVHDLRDPACTELVDRFRHTSPQLWTRFRAG
jgi:cytosine deaminase